MLPEQMRFRLGLDGRVVAGAPQRWLLEAPGFVRLSSLALRLRQPMRRAVIAGAPGYEATYDVAIRPDRTGLDIEAALIAARPVAAERAPGVARSHPLMRDEGRGAIRWTCDARLRLTSLVADHLGEAFAPSGWIGRPLSQLFLLEAERNGNFPILQALADEAPFLLQHARLPHSGDGSGSVAVRLSGRPILDHAFAGFEGQADWAEAETRVDAHHPSPSLVLEAGDPPDRQFGRFVDSALRAPLNRIIAGADSMADEVDGPIRADYARYAHDIAGAARHLMTLVDDLSDLRVVEHPDFRVTLEPVVLTDVAERAANLLRLRASHRGVQLVIDTSALEQSSAPVVAGEQRRVLQILLNLIGNAIRYGPDKAVVTMRITATTDMGNITVVDQGSGIDPDLWPRLFTRFERLGRTDAGGSGLGLYISRTLARAMQGDLMVGAHEGGGAQFTLTLPIWPAGRD